MPLGSLSERDRLRLAELIRGPLIPPAPRWSFRKQAILKRSERVWYAGRKKLRGQWDTWSTKARWDGWSRKARWDEWSTKAWWDKWSAKARWDGWPIQAWLTQLAAHWKQVAAGGAVAVACLLALAVSVRLGSRPETRSIQFHALDRQGQLQIRWDPESDPIRRARGAKLFITDGTDRLFVDLDARLLRRGVVSYARASGVVDLRLALAEPDGRLVEQRAIFFGEPPPDADRSRLQASAQQALPVVPVEPVTVGPIKPVSTTEHRSRRKSLAQSGRNLPFTCAAGDTFRKTDSAPGWDTFTCRGKNVWGVSTTQLGEDRPSNRPSDTLTAKPAHESTPL
jgi:hypothetical protein